MIGFLSSNNLVLIVNSCYINFFSSIKSRATFFNSSSDSSSIKFVSKAISFAEVLKITSQANSLISVISARGTFFLNNQ